MTTINNGIDTGFVCMNRKIRILRIVGRCKTGGTESILLNYYRFIDHDSFAMDFLFYGDSTARYNKELSYYGDRVINVTDYTKNLFKSVLEIANAVRKGKYDIVHAQLNSLNFFPLLGAMIGGAKVRIAANHSTDNLRYERKKSVLKRILRPSIKLVATDYVACSKHAARWCYGERALKEGRVRIIQNAIDLNKYSFDKEKREMIREKMGWNGRFVIGHIGRFTEQKNHGFLLDVFADIHKIDTDGILVLIGSGHTQKSVEAKVNKMGLNESVFFLGLRYDVYELMQGMDVLLFPSLYEGLGNVIIEAQAVGLRAVVSSNVPREAIVTNLVDTLSLEEPPSEWAKVALKYVHGYEHENTHESLRNAGYDIRIECNELEKYYKSLLTTKRGPFLE